MFESGCQQTHKLWEFSTVFRTCPTDHIVYDSMRCVMLYWAHCKGTRVSCMRRFACMTNQILSQSVAKIMCYGLTTRTAIYKHSIWNNVEKLLHSFISNRSSALCQSSTLSSPVSTPHTADATCVHSCNEWGSVFTRFRWYKKEGWAMHSKCLLLVLKCWDVTGLMLSSVHLWVLCTADSDMLLQLILSGCVIEQLNNWIETIVDSLIHVWGMGPWTPSFCEAVGIQVNLSELTTWATSYIV